MNTETLDEQVKWYAICTRPKEEDRADLNLRSWSVQTFSPKFKERSASGYGRERESVSKPLFANYLFARFDANKQLHKINYTRGVSTVVSFAGSPVSIDDEIIDLLKARVGQDGFVSMDADRVSEDLQSGDKVRINSGPFESMVGVFKRRTKDKARVKILLDAMNYQSHLEIEREMVEKVN
jgi:transcription elongation factor/antiterminator RfaH